MLVIALIGNNKAPVEREYAHLLDFFEAEIFAILIHQGGSNKLRRLIQALEPLPSRARLTLLSVLHELGPQPFVLCCHIALDSARHLRRQVEVRTNRLVASSMHAEMTAHFPMCKSVARDVVERITIGKLRRSQELELLRRRMQFEFGGQHLFHKQSIAKDL